ncbi:MAG: nucleotide exchange factor GrpE [Candidatus Latescibacteria bacterium]|nr:nucleotide exchange factor GrpE [Candidatus Latescibacterota bacterium]
MARDQEAAENVEEEVDAQEAEQPEAEAADSSEQTAVESEDEESSEPTLEQVQVEAAANYDRYVRAVAELDNFRKRNVKVRTDAREDILRDMVLKVGPALDNFNRALNQESEDYQGLKQGVELIYNQLKEALQGYGIEAIEAVGQPFDPVLHEALLEVEHDEFPAGTVVDEVEKGYQLNDKVVRPSRVVVSKGAAAKDE